MDAKKLLSNKLSSILLAIFCCILWATAFPLLKISYTHMQLSTNDIFSKILFAGYRFFIASIILFLVTKYFIKQSIKVNNNLISKLIILGLLQTFFQYTFFYNGLANTAGLKAAVLAPISTFFIVIFAHFIYKDDKLNKYKIIGLVAGFGGIIIINLNDLSLSGGITLLGEGFLILAGIVNASGNLYAKKLSNNLHPFTITAWQMFLGSTLLILIGFLGKGSLKLNFDIVSFTIFIYLSIQSATAFSIWYSLLKFNKAGEISLLKFIIPVIASILTAVLIPNETLTIYNVTALVLVATGIIIININKKSFKKERIKKYDRP